MGSSRVHRPTIGEVLAVARHRVVTRQQLLGLGFSGKAIRHRLSRGRLFEVHPQVYAIGAPDLGNEGEWIAAVFACGEGALLSHRSAGALWGLVPWRGGLIDVSVPARRNPRPRGVRVHRRTAETFEVSSLIDRIAVTSVIQTFIDLATELGDDEIHGAVREGDRLERVDPEGLRRALEGHTGQPGAGRLRTLLDRETFTLTDSELERRFIPIARRVGLPHPLTQVHVNGFRVDFYWPHLGLVVETDGLRYHRTPTQQTRDRVRDQTHTAAGMTPLRFTRAQVRWRPSVVEAVLRRTVRQLELRLNVQ